MSGRDKRSIFPLPWWVNGGTFSKPCLCISYLETHRMQNGRDEDIQHWEQFGIWTALKWPPTRCAHTSPPALYGKFFPAVLSFSGDHIRPTTISMLNRTGLPFPIQPRCNSPRCLFSCCFKQFASLVPNARFFHGKKESDARSDQVRALPDTALMPYSPKTHIISR